MWRDLERLAPSFRSAVPPARAVSAEQPAGGAGRAGRAGDRRNGARISAARCSAREFAEGRRIDDAATPSAISLSGLNVDAAAALEAAQSDAIKRALRAETEEAQTARHLRRAELHHRRRRVVLGQRPAGAGAAPGREARSASRKARPHATARDRAASAGRRCAMWLLASRTDVLAEMEDRGRQHRGGVAVADALDQMIESADAARGDHRHRHRVGDRAGERDVETGPGAVAVHRGEQDFAGAERHHLARIVDRIEPGRIAAAVGENLPAVRLARLRHLLGVDRHHDALVAEFLRRLLARRRGGSPRRC